MNRISLLAAARLKGIERLPTFGPYKVAYFYEINCIESTKDHRYDATLLRSD